MIRLGVWLPAWTQRTNRLVRLPIPEVEHGCHWIVPIDALVVQATAAAPPWSRSKWKCGGPIIKRFRNSTNPGYLTCPMGNCCIDAKLTIARQITQLISKDKLEMMRTQLSITHITEPSLTCDYAVLRLQRERRARIKTATAFGWDCNKKASRSKARLAWP